MVTKVAVGAYEGRVFLKVNSKTPLLIFPPESEFYDRLIFSQLFLNACFVYYFCFKMIMDFLKITSKQMSNDASEDFVNYVGDNFFVADIDCGRH